MKLIKKGKDAVTGTPNIQVKVREATSNKKWGPTGAQMHELARASFHYQNFAIMMRMIWKRLNDHGKNWRHIYKSLLLLDYLVKNGSKQVINDARIHIPNIQTLTTYQLIDKHDRDVGQSVRERARAIIDLLNDEPRLAEERAKAKANRGKYGDAMSNQSAQHTQKRGGYPPGVGGHPQGQTARRATDSSRGRPQAQDSSRNGGRVRNGSDSESDSSDVSSSDYSDEDEVPPSEPIPSDWLNESDSDSDSDREETPSRHHPQQQRDHRKASHRSDHGAEKRNTRGTSKTDSAPDMADKLKQLRDMFPQESQAVLQLALQHYNGSISDTALALSDQNKLKRIRQFAGEVSAQGQHPQGQAAARHAEHQQKAPRGSVAGIQPAHLQSPSLIDLWDLNMNLGGPQGQAQPQGHNPFLAGPAGGQQQWSQQQQRQQQQVGGPYGQPQQQVYQQQPPQHGQGHPHQGYPHSPPTSGGVAAATSPPSSSTPSATEIALRELQLKQQQLEQQHQLQQQQLQRQHEEQQRRFLEQTKQQQLQYQQYLASQGFSPAGLPNEVFPFSFFFSLPIFSSNVRLTIRLFVFLFIALNNCRVVHAQGQQPTSNRDRWDKRVIPSKAS
ncbi:Epsin-3, clathrin recruitment and traffic between the Golgi and endosome, variant 2 [Balamuthia mandrillaris]